jgi:hypothetical protein
MKHFLTFFIVLSVLTVPVFPFSGEGSGTEYDPYQITDVEQLQEMENELDAHYIIMNDIDASETEDWNDGTGFDPIGGYTSGTPSDGFTGSLDGAEYTISGLYINKDDDYIGLFGCIADGGHVYDVNVENANVIGNDKSGIFVGIVYGYGDGSEVSIAGCTSSGTISGGNFTGGFSGLNLCNGGSFIGLDDCSSTADVSGNENTGGFCGGNDNKGDLEISSCFSTGDVSSGRDYVGGFCGFEKSWVNGSTSISECYSTGNVDGNNKSGGFIGFIRTYSNNSEINIEYCSSSGDVSGYEYVGGFCGLNQGDLGAITISYCYSNGNATGDDDYVGGFCGSNYNYVMSASLIIENCFSAGNASGGNYVGGFTGANSEGSGVAEISYCYSYGVNEGSIFTGGFCGDNSGTINNCYWDTEASGSSMSDGGTGKTTSQMHTESTFEGWDFDDVWELDEGYNWGYPILLYMPTEYKCSPAEEFTGDGSGTENDPYQITNVCQLQEMKHNLEAYYIIMNDIDASDTENWNDGLGFKPIGVYDEGDPDVAFTGSLDGQEYSITGLYIDLFDSNVENVGMFSCIADGAEIKDVNIENAYVNARKRSGILVGEIDCYDESSEILIDGCSTSGSVSGPNSIGGFVGCMLATAGTITINNSSSSAEVSSTGIGSAGFAGFVKADGGDIYFYNSYSDGDIEGEEEANGGFIGKFRNMGGTVIAENCYANGDVTIDGNTSGGFFGSLWIDGELAIIKNCYATGDVIGNSNTGGFAGKISTNDTESEIIIENCYASGNVNGTGVAGGFCGGNVSEEGSTKISYCYSTGNVSCVYASAGGFCGENYGEGYSGDGEAIISHCYATGNVTSEGEDAGGFCGSNDCDSFDKTCSIEYCYSTGNVYSEDDNVGGFCGQNKGTHGEAYIKNCYSYGNADAEVDNVGGFCGRNYGNCGTAQISDCYSFGNASAIREKVGGFIGYNDHYCGTGSSYAIIERCYSIGTVSGSGDLGGFCGFQESGTPTEINDCYWDTETSEMNDSDGGTGKTTSQMQTESTYTDWDFDEIWMLYEGINNDYPFFIPELMWPELTSPVDEEVVLDLTPEFEWESVSGAENYTLQVSTGASFTSLEINTTTSNTTFEATSDFEENTTYYWRVQSHNDDYDSWWSPVWSFEVEDPIVPPDLVSPEDEAIAQERNLTLEWDIAENATEYNIEVSLNLDMSNPIIEGNTSEHEYDISNLDFNTTYYWRVQSSNGSNTSDWSAAWSFTTRDELQAPILSSPVDNATDQERNLTLDWNTVTLASEYEIEVSINVDMSAPFISETLTDTERDLSGIDYNTTYYWRVRCTDGIETSDWSQVWEFTTREPMEIPILLSPLDEAISQERNLTLDWQIVTLATEYEIEVSTNADMSDPFILESLAETERDLSDLDFNTTYYWRVRCTDGIETSDWSAVWEFTTREPMEAPILQSPIDEATSQERNLTLDWNTVNLASEYEIEVSTNADMTEPFISETITDTERELSDLDYNTIYYWRVRCTDGIETSDWSEVWEFTTREPMEVPILLSPIDETIAQERNLTLDWQIVTLATEYEIEVSTNEDMTEQFISETLTETERDLSNLEYSTTYYWRVRCTDGIETSEWSEVWEFTTRAPLEVPTLLSPLDEAISQERNLTLDWQDVTLATEYEIEVSINQDMSDPFILESLVETERDLSGLDYNAIYYWRVRCTDGIETSDWSQVWEFTTREPMEVPTLLSPLDESNAQERNLSLDWQIITLATEYEIEVSINGDMTEPFISETLTDTERDLSNLEYSTTYYWRVRCTDGIETSDWSEVWEFTTREPMEIPALLSPSDEAISQERNLSLGWQIVTLATEYEIEVSINADISDPFISENLTETERELTSLDYNTTYYWRVRCTDGIETSDWSAVWEFTTRAPLEVPTLLSPSDEAISQERNLTLDWNTVNLAFEYEIEVSINADMSAPFISENLTDTERDLSNLEYSTTYYWRVRCTDGIETSDWSQVWEFTTREPMDVPTLLSPLDEAISQERNLTLDWQIVTLATEYEIEVSTNEDMTEPFISETLTETERDLSNLEYSTTYYWRVRCTDGIETSGWSQVWEFTTREPMDVPTLLSPIDEAIAQERNLTLDWQVITLATEYEIEVSTNEDMTDPFISENLTDTERDLSGIDYNTTYYWRVRCTDGVETSEWSEVWEFTTREPMEVPTLLSPSDKAISQERNLTLDWNTVNLASEYEIEVSTNADMTEPFISETLTDTERELSDLRLQYYIFLASSLY